MNRLLLFQSDDSVVRTSEVLKRIVDRYDHAKSFEAADVDSYIDYFESLESFPVPIPFGDQIRFDPTQTVNRRSAKIFLDLLSTVALLNQTDREKRDGVLVADWQDLEMLLEFASIPTEHETCVVGRDRQVMELIKERYGAGVDFTYLELQA